MAGGGSQSGVEKASILLMSVGEDVAGEIMKHLAPAEVRKIGNQMINMADIPEESFFSVANEFFEKSDNGSLSVDNEFIKNTLVKALGADKAGMVIERMVDNERGETIDSLQWMEPVAVADIVRNEHPQTIALLLSYLEPEHASRVLSELPERIRPEIVMRIATSESVSPWAIKELEEALSESMSEGSSVVSSDIGGVHQAAEILNQMNSSNEDAIMDYLRKDNVTLAEEIQAQMFVFNDLIGIDDMGIQTMLKEVSNEKLVLALKVAEEELKEKIFNNMSERARDMLKEDLETRGPVKLVEVEKAKQEIVNIARRLEEEGKIVIGGKGAEDVLV